MAGPTTFVTPDLGPDRPTHTSQAAGKQRGKRIVFVSLYFSVASVVKYGISITFFASHLYVLFFSFCCLFSPCFLSPFFIFCFSGFNVNFSAFYFVVGVFLFVFFVCVNFCFLCAFFSFFIFINFQLFKTVFSRFSLL